MQFCFLFAFAVLWGTKVWAQMPIHPLLTEKSTTQHLLNIYQDSPQSFFCQHTFDQDGQLAPFSNSLLNPSIKITWHLVVSKQQLAQHRACYQEKICVNKKNQRFKGLRCCKQSDPLYNIMTHDLHNRLPITPQLQKILNKVKFDALQEKFGSETFCNIYYDPKQQILDIPNTKKGEIARIHLYMSDTYNLNMSQSERLLYTQWHNSYPPSKWEKQKNIRIEAIQGNRNPFIH